MFRRVALPEHVPGHLHLHSMPGYKESFGEFLSAAREVALSLMVCLAPDFEVQSKSPAYYAARCADAMPFPVEDLPIADFGVPSEDRRAELIELVQHVADELRKGEEVLLHCRMGIGRTGTVAACVLLALGIGEEASLQRVRSAGGRPESASQRDLIRWYASACARKSE